MMDWPRWSCCDGAQVNGHRAYCPTLRPRDERGRFSKTATCDHGERFGCYKCDQEAEATEECNAENTRVGWP